MVKHRLTRAVMNIPIVKIHLYVGGASEIYSSRRFRFVSESQRKAAVALHSLTLLADGYCIVTRAPHRHIRVNCKVKIPEFLVLVGIISHVPIRTVAVLPRIFFGARVKNSFKPVFVEINIFRRVVCYIRK